MKEKKALLYEVITNDLMAQIQEGRYKPGDQVPTETELAHDYNVSMITSKRALEELNRSGIIYRQRGKGSFVATAGADKPMLGTDSSIVAMVVPFPENVSFAANVISALSSTLNANNVWLTIHNTNRDVKKERAIINKLLDDGITSIVLYPVSRFENMDLIYKLMLMDANLIILDKYFNNFEVNCILSDNFNGGYQAADHLAGMGHKNICFVSDIAVEQENSVRERLLGFYSAIWDNDIDFGAQNFFTLPYLDVDSFLLHNGDNETKWIDSGKRSIDRIYNEFPDVTALQCLHDYLAIQLLKSAQALGINVPGDLSIIGFDDVDNLAHLDVPLTTIAQNFIDIGKKAAERMLELLRRGRVPCAPKKILVPVGLIQRKSCAPPKV